MIRNSYYPKIKDDGEYYSTEEYAAFWGCDPCYDREPRLPGDGYLFYNFSSEKNVRTKEYLDNFVAAIERTIEACKQDILIKCGYYSQDDVDNLEQLKKHVQNLTL